MLNQTPREYCDANGIKENDCVEVTFGDRATITRTITALGVSSVLFIAFDGSEMTWSDMKDIRECRKISPPRFAIVGHARQPGNIPGEVFICYTIRTRPDDVDELYRRVSAAIAEPESKGDGSEGHNDLLPYYCRQNNDSDYSVYYCGDPLISLMAYERAHELPHDIDPDSICRRHIEAITAEINARASGTVAG